MEESGYLSRDKVEDWALKRRGYLMFFSGRDVM